MASQDLPASTDLFVGELFGDDLVEIYNAAIEGTNTADHEIPVLPPQPIDLDCDEHKNDDSGNHPGAKEAATAAAIDDGLSTLLPPSATPGNEGQKRQQESAAIIEEKKEIAPYDSSSIGAALSATDGSGVKRKANTTLDSPTLKKQPFATATVPSKCTLPETHSRIPLTLSSENATKATTTTKQKDTKSISAIVQKDLKPPSVLSSSSGAAAAAAAAAANQASCIPVSKDTCTNSCVPDDAASNKSLPAKSSSEADFKSVAQAAVSSLIFSTKNGDQVTTSKAEADIDTSTDHIKALTGSNWVAACSGGGASAAGVCTGTSLATDAKANNRSKRQNLTADERAKQNRDRNREHARNTRLRKKAYVEELKRTLTELVAQRDKAEMDKRQAAEREVEQREVRFRVIEEFLKLRGRNEPNFASWAAILDQNFSLTLPATELSDVAGGEMERVGSSSIKLEKVYSGVADVMNESASFASFLQSLGNAETIECNMIGFVYKCDRSDFFMDDNHAVLDWGAGTTGLTLRGAQSELEMRGSIHAEFCPASNKLISASIMYDTGAVLTQLQEFMDLPVTTSFAAVQADAILERVLPIVPQGDSSDESA